MRANGVLVVVSLAQFIVLVDAVVVNVALPTIKRDVGFSDQNLAWIIDAHLLTFGGFLLLGGRLADRAGRWRMFTVGLSLFTGASLLCGLSQSGLGYLPFTATATAASASAVRSASQS